MTSYYPRLLDPYLKLRALAFFFAARALRAWAIRIGGKKLGSVTYGKDLTLD